MKECWGCGNYQAYYTKGYSKFDIENLGNCSKRKKIVNKHESCEHWRINAIRRKIRKTVCIKVLAEALSNLLEIKQMLNEEYEENKINPISDK